MYLDLILLKKAQWLKEMLFLEISSAQEIVKKLSELGVCAIQVIGADMNATTLDCTGRFDIFRSKHFNVLEPKGHTNVNPSALSDKERKIDYIITRNRQGGIT